MTIAGTGIPASGKAWFRGVNIWMILWTLSTLAAETARAADTIEPYEIGLSDYELYFAYGGVGKPNPERSLSAQLQLGIGITERLSGYVNASGDADGELSNPTATVGFGLFGTPIDTAYFDLDIGLDGTIGNLGAGGDEEETQYSITPFIELNLDSDPEMEGYGLFLLLEHSFTGQDDSSVDTEGRVHEEFSITWGTAVTVGAYYAVREGHQAFLTFNFSFDRHRTEIGGVALGYNFFVVGHILEIITEVNLDIPQGNEAFGVDLLFGFIATLPG